MPDKTVSALENPGRLDALERSGLLDSAPEAAFDRMTALAGKILHAPVSLVTLIDRDRQFFKSEIGLEAAGVTVRETPLSHSICQHLIGSTEPLIVADAREHPLIQENLAVTQLGVVAYAGVPLTTSKGYSLGSLCAIDTQPRQWTQEEIDILTDLAAFTMTEIELRLAARELQENYRQLQKLEALRDDLTHMIIHDLRTPLTSLLMGLETIPLLGKLNDEQRECMNISLNGGQILQQMISDLLDISKMENGQLQLEREEIAPQSLAKKALIQVDSWAKAKNISVCITASSAIPVLLADENMLLRTLVNLLSNAIKFTPPNGQVTLVVDYMEEKNAVEFAVSDTGEGIPSGDLERIFEKFAQAESRQSGRGKGMSTGLGLTFCKLTVEAHGGEIWVESEIDAGSTFRFSVPRQN